MKWRKVLGYSKPPEFEKGVTTVYFRKEIVEITTETGHQAWEYDEAQMSLSEYDRYLEILESPEMTIVLEQFEKQNEALTDNSITQASIAAETEYQTCLMELNSTM